MTCIISFEPNNHDFFLINFISHYKDRKCADNKNPCSAHIVSVKLYTYNCTLAIPLRDYLPFTGKRGMKNRQLLN